jgi:hypothetical protein
VVVVDRRIQLEMEEVALADQAEEQPMEPP